MGLLGYNPIMSKEDLYTTDGEQESYNLVTS